jgi:enoyl-CoA hydratase
MCMAQTLARYNATNSMRVAPSATLCQAMTFRGSYMLNVEHHANVAKLTLNNPTKGNALNPVMVEALIEQTTLALANDGIDTIELHAEGMHFCTGLDLSNLDNETDGDLLHRLVRIETFLALIWSAPITTKAFAKGRTWGAGADIFVACEHRFTESNATFRFPGAQFGIALGTARLADRIGIDEARHLILHGKEFDASNAIQKGLATDFITDHTISNIVVGREAAAAIRAASRTTSRADADMAALVRSASLPGLKQRIIQYRERAKKK